MTMRSKRARISTTPARRTKMDNSKRMRVRGKMYLLSRTMRMTASILGVPGGNMKGVQKI